MKTLTTIKEAETNKTLKVHVNKMHHYVQRVKNANLQYELLERRRRILMTLTIAKKNTASYNVDMDDIPNLENSYDEQAFKSTESINR